MFHAALATFFSHELDAILQHEWRLLYLLRTLRDAAGARYFIALHVPLFALITYGVFHHRHFVQTWFRRLLSAFFVCHAGLHWRLMGDPLAPFDSVLSLLLILGCALAGAIHLTMEFSANRCGKSSKEA